MLARLISFGELLLTATESPAFADRRSHELVVATLQILRDDLVLWHRQLNSPDKNAVVLAACFPE